MSQVFHVAASQLLIKKRNGIKPYLNKNKNLNTNNAEKKKKTVFNQKWIETKMKVKVENLFYNSVSSWSE